MRTQTVTLNVPVLSFDWTSKITTRLKNTGLFIYTSFNRSVGIFNSFISTLTERRQKRNSVNENPQSPERKFNKISIGKAGKPVKYALLGLIIIAVVFAAGKEIIKRVNSSNSSTTNTDIRPALATLSLNKELSFPLNDENSKKVADIKYLVESAELRDEILVQGQRATAVKGRLFLVLTIKITNDYKSSIQINSKDYVRLSVNANENEWLAPDIHNDPVEVQAISTKYTRVGFAINTSDKDLVLSVGEVGGEKEKIPLSFQK